MPLLDVQIASVSIGWRLSPPGHLLGASFVPRRRCHPPACSHRALEAGQAPGHRGPTRERFGPSGWCRLLGAVGACNNARPGSIAVACCTVCRLAPSWPQLVGACCCCFCRCCGCCCCCCCRLQALGGCCSVCHDAHPCHVHAPPLPPLHRVSLVDAVAGMLSTEHTCLVQ
jgi:hypothetical protein